MARRSHMSQLKRQRELRKAEKAARKRAKRHGVEEQQGAPLPSRAVQLSPGDPIPRHPTVGDEQKPPDEGKPDEGSTEQAADDEPK